MSACRHLVPTESKREGVGRRRRGLSKAQNATSNTLGKKIERSRTKHPHPRAARHHTECKSRPSDETLLGQCLARIDTALQHLPSQRLDEDEGACARQACGSESGDETRGKGKRASGRGVEDCRRVRRAAARHVWLCPRLAAQPTRAAFRRALWRRVYCTCAQWREPDPARDPDWISRRLPCAGHVDPPPGFFQTFSRCCLSLAGTTLQTRRLEVAVVLPSLAAD